MKALTLLAIPLLLIAGCASEQGDNTEPAEQAATAAVGEMSEHGLAATAAVVTGNLACGHCTFKKTESCAAGLQTADGKMYILDGVDADSELFKERLSGKEVRVVGTVQDGDDDLRHITVESYQM